MAGLTTTGLSLLTLSFLFPASFSGAPLGPVPELLVFGAISLVLLWQVSRWRRTERELRFSEARLRRLVEVTSQTVWVTDAEGTVVEDSPSWSAVPGEGPSTLAGKSWLELVHPDDRPRVSEQWQRVAVSCAPYHTQFRSGTRVASTASCRSGRPSAPSE